MTTQHVPLTVKLSPDVAAAFKRTCGNLNIGATEGIRRAIALWTLADAVYRKGNRLVIVEDLEEDMIRWREILGLDGTT